MEVFLLVEKQCLTPLCINKPVDGSKFCDKHKYIENAEPMENGDDAFEFVYKKRGKE